MCSIRPCLTKITSAKSGSAQSEGVSRAMTEPGLWTKTQRSPPMTTAKVGVTRVTTPLADRKRGTSFYATPAKLSRRARTGMGSTTSPDVQGTKKDSPTLIQNMSLMKMMPFRSKTVPSACKH